MLREYIGGREEIEVASGQTAREMLATLKIPSELVALVSVNGEMKNKDYVLLDGDLVRIMAVIGGG
jgi:sulfur carrier protein ThiS